MVSAFKKDLITFNRPIGFKERYAHLFSIFEKAIENGAIQDVDIILTPSDPDEYPDYPNIYPTTGDSTKQRHYKLLVVITSHIDEMRTRKLLREYLFGIKDNLRPCMEKNGEIYYRFLMKPYQQTDKKVLRDFTAEAVEYDDIEEFPNQSNMNWQKTVLTWIQSLEKQEITFDYAVIMEDQSIINLRKLLSILDSSVINTQTLTPRQKSNLVWGRFDTNTNDEMFIILGQERHGYSFVGRSEEFDQQAHYKHRRTVWGKIDSIEKILPHYDWVFWLDMDTVIANQSISVEWLFEKFTERVGGEDNFSKINLVVARPKQDSTINAGVFMIRNSEWSRKFLRATQARRDLYFNRQMEQRAMWELLISPDYKDGTLLLDRDDHTFNTFPHMYVPGDFVVHWAPDDCPVKPILDAIGKLKQYEMNREFKFTLNHAPDH
ncbi:6191_t:CDS:2 [Racocetra fulgida]|uniref:6191_t:CDS:1 n=1 Tax=Racocetra fulgida TaxID=60492 RepID=A0A9N8VQA1_9GLOM|nr:6191_t:CDS:2 [Racocetra fulgida]